MHYDFKDLLRVFNEKQVRYLVVGGDTLIEYTEPRYTKDFDVWADRDLSNQEAWKNHVEIDFGGVYAKVISKQDLIRNKRASGRPQDVIDAELLVGNEGDKH